MVHTVQCALLIAHSTFCKCHSLNWQRNYCDVVEMCAIASCTAHYRNCVLDYSICGYICKVGVNYCKHCDSGSFFSLLRIRFWRASSGGIVNTGLITIIFIPSWQFLDFRKKTQLVMCIILQEERDSQFFFFLLLALFFCYVCICSHPRQNLHAQRMHRCVHCAFITKMKMHFKIQHRMDERGTSLTQVKTIFRN